MHIDLILDAIYSLPPESRGRLTQDIKEVSYPKGYILLRAQKIENSIYFIKKGIVRAYESSTENEVTFWFGQEGDPVISMKSYIKSQKGYEDIELLENTELYQISTQKLQALFNEDLHIANWGRKLAEQELIKTEERLIAMQFKTATQRYKDLLEQQPGLFNRVSLGHIASYLGITQVSLSRIRAEIR
ncbi:Crp/Fnr family transcriptional regulator [Niabella hibiscisoli]|uniref:Crp/Fnr family transcriptional regulator n=1 Tax=Niabella hibiscisoli TaxID=1825928 RepID=UPI001F0F5266|nr:Crp/Fnr family transcriptional regulator [Niabella hibiscisoli]MCH5716229.1 Crp/Fnr family transcriptional regulator [Niabella hibiscisoli]